VRIILQIRFQNLIWKKLLTTLILAEIVHKVSYFTMRKKPAYTHLRVTHFFFEALGICQQLCSSLKHCEWTCFLLWLHAINTITYKISRSGSRQGPSPNQIDCSIPGLHTMTPLQRRTIPVVWNPMYWKSCWCCGSFSITKWTRI
jgi:hypothetical protein